jgi:hypothetical protein
MNKIKNLFKLILKDNSRQGIDFIHLTTLFLFK